MSGLFLRQSELAVPDNVVSASSEDGLTNQAPLAASANAGYLQLRASGTPTAVSALDLALQRGGLPMGWASVSNGVPGVSHRWRNTGDGATQWRGHTENAFLTYVRMVGSVASATQDYPKASEPRILKNGNLGFVRLVDGVLDSLVFCYKSSRTATWTFVNIAVASVDFTVRPAWAVLPSGRLVAYARLTTTGHVISYYSDDHGLTWTKLADNTRISCAADRDLCCEAVGDAVCVVVGGNATTTFALTIFWSLDGGSAFALSYTSSTARGTVRTAVSAGQLLLAYPSPTTGAISVAPVGVGGGPGTAVSAGATTVTANPTLAMTAHDDGTVWLFHGASGYPNSLLAAAVSLDNGATWVGPYGSGSVTVFDNREGNEGYISLNLGSWQGSLVLIGVTDSDAAATDNSLHELWFGGWDSLTEAIDETSPGTLHADTNLYNYIAYTPTDLPENLTAWTRTNTGAGATVALGDGGLNIVGAAGDNSSWNVGGGALTWNPSSADGWRFRFVYRVNSGGSGTSGMSRIFVSVASGANRQWIEVGFSTDIITLQDTSGSLASSASVANQFTAFTEVLIAFAPYTTASVGRCSVWYRIAGSTHWTNIASNQSIAEQAGAATETLAFGGGVAGVVDWDIAYFGVSQGAGNLYDGFTNPDDLNGRPLSASVDHYVTNGVHIGAYGGPGVKADTFTYASTYHFAAKNIWLNHRPSCYHQTTADATTANVVFGSATNNFHLDTVILAGINFPRVTLELNATDAWGAPSVSAAFDGIVWQGSSTSNGKGYFRVDGHPFFPGEYRSQPGRRWYVEVGSVGGLVFEIADNGTNELRISGLADTFGATTLRIFGDRMGLVLPVDHTYLYGRLSYPSMNTADNNYRTGSLFLGMRHDITEPYDSGFVDIWRPNIGQAQTKAGYVSSWKRGPEKHEIRQAWGPIDRLSNNYMGRIVHHLRALDGEHGLMAFWRDITDPRTIGIYRVKGPIAKENVYGELRDEFARLAQIILIEEPGK